MDYTPLTLQPIHYLPSLDRDDLGKPRGKPIVGKGVTEMRAKGELKSEMEKKYKELNGRLYLDPEGKMQEAYLRILLGEYSE